MSGDSWNEWGKHVLEELQRLSNEQRETRRELSELRGEVSYMRGRAAGVAAITGVLVSLLMLSLKWAWSAAGHH